MIFNIILYLLVIFASVIMIFVVLRDIGWSISQSIISSSIILLFWCFVLAIVISMVFTVRGPAWENRCKLTLRALGSMQTAFAEKNKGNYGSWQELTDADFIQEGYNRTNMIDNYSIIAFEIKKATLCDLAEGTTNSSFTIIAVPRYWRTMQNKRSLRFFPRRHFLGVNVIFTSLPSYYTHRGFRLRTFAICEDQTPRFWVGVDSEWTTENINLRNEELWKPLR